MVTPGCLAGSQLPEGPSPGWLTVPISTMRTLTLATFRYGNFCAGGKMRC